MREVKAWSFAVPNLAGLCSFPTPRQLADSIKLINYLKDLDGFLGIHPMPPRGTMVIFRTKNDAIRAKNLLIYDLEINEIGNNIVECYIPEEYARVDNG